MSDSSGGFNAIADDILVSAVYILQIEQFLHFSIAGRLHDPVIMGHCITAVTTNTALEMSVRVCA